MGAVSTLTIDQRVLEEVPINHNLFGGGYMDYWGSSYRVSRVSDGRLMLKFDSVGGYLSENAYDGWENDSVIKSIREEKFSGVFSQWALDRINTIKPETRCYDLDYGFINNELMFVSQNGIVFWKAPGYLGGVTDLVDECVKANPYFFDYEWTKPIRMATAAECAAFPLREPPRPISDEKPLIVSYTVRESPAMSKFIDRWVKEVVK